MWLTCEVGEETVWLGPKTRTIGVKLDDSSTAARREPIHDELKGDCSMAAVAAIAADDEDAEEEDEYDEEDDEEEEVEGAGAAVTTPPPARAEAATSSPRVSETNLASPSWSLSGRRQRMTRSFSKELNEVCHGAGMTAG